MCYIYIWVCSRHTVYSLNESLSFFKNLVYIFPRQNQLQLTSEPHLTAGSQGPTSRETSCAYDAVLWNEADARGPTLMGRGLEISRFIHLFAWGI